MKLKWQGSFFKNPPDGAGCGLEYLKKQDPSTFKVCNLFSNEPYFNSTYVTGGCNLNATTVCAICEHLIKGEQNLQIFLAC